MKRGKDEEKIMEPMFPRLHVNDTEKGWPRAPPRNKMALYEQLSIPSQRFGHVVLPCNPNNAAANMVHPPSQGGGNDGGIFFARQMHPRLPSEQQYSQYSESSTPISQVEQEKKLDEDDYTVPIFDDSAPTESDKYSNDINSKKVPCSDPPYLHRPSKFLKAKGTELLENSSECIDSLGNDDSGDSQLLSDTEKRNSQKALPLEDQNTFHDHSNDTGSLEDGYCGPRQTGNLERGDSVSETSILDAVSAPDLTTDDAVGTMGQKHFWKARRAIANQQRIFAFQVFELHRLIKVQKLIASSPHLLHDHSAYFGKPTKPLTGKKRPSDFSIKDTSDPSKGENDHPENPSQKKERSAENAVEKASLASAQNEPPPPGPSTTDSEHNASTACFSHPQAHQWLIPIMSPTEGLIYKPYPGTGFGGQACGPPVPNPMIGNFPTPGYGIPAPVDPYPFPSFPPFGPHGYISPYAMPMMATSAFSAEQTNPPPCPARFSALEAAPTVPTQKDGQESKVQGSSASCLSERRASSPERRNVLPFSMSSPGIDASNVGSESEGCVAERRSKVIKVVPHNGISASEFAERIFRSIQEERKKYDSV